MRGAFVDPGGDLDKLKQALVKTGVTLEKILVTHGHMDHCGQAGVLARDMGVPIEGPHQADRFWIEGLDDSAMRFGLPGERFELDRWLMRDRGRPLRIGLACFQSDQSAPSIFAHLFAWAERVDGYQHIGGIGNGFARQRFDESQLCRLG